MEKHTKVYMKYFGFDESSWIPCEMNCGRQAVDIHHIVPRSRQGKDQPENLAALCRECHEEAGRSREFNDMVSVKHRKRMLAGSKFENITKIYYEDTDYKQLNNY